MLGTNLNHILDVEFTVNNNKITCSDKKVKCQIINLIDGYIIAVCERK